MKISYRPEIDGLRALAVLFVIFYHAEIEIFNFIIFKGGYIGVDIFFVISGYLITSILLKELNIKKNISFKYFYERRVRRILPVLLFVILVSIPFAWLYLLPINLIDFFKSILFSIGFSSNYYFWFTGNSYGAENSLLIPFLNTWSLSIEEQYYILFPIFLLVIFKLFHKYIGIILIITFVTSSLLAIWGSTNYPLFNFYGLPTRAWELLTGSIISYYREILMFENKYKRLKNFLPSLGLFSIIYFVFFIDKSTNVPSVYTIPPIIGISLIILYSSKNNFILKILSSKLFVGVGLISYSLYLWHYPIFAIARSKSNIFFESNKSELILLTLFLSIITYYFIEKKFRNPKTSFKYLFFYLLFFLTIIISTSKIFIDNKGVIFKKNKILLEEFSNKPWLNLKNNQGKFCYEIHSKKSFCDFEKKENKKKLILIGDSTVESMGQSFKKHFFDKGYNLALMNSGHCYFNPDYDFNNTDLEKFCSLEFQNKRMKFLSQNPNSILVIGGELKFLLDTFIQDDQLYIDQYISHVNNLLLEGFKIIQLTPTPRSDINVGKYFINQLKNGKIDFNNKILKYPSKNYIKDLDKIYRIFEKIDHKNYKIVNLKNLFCDEKYCYLNDEEKIFFVDQAHPSNAGSDLIANYLFKIINN